jgi:hypothetical protein
MAQPYAASEQQIPPAVYQQASVYNLGTPTGIFKPRFANPLAIIGIALGITIADIIVLVAILMAAGYLFYILITIPIAAIIWMIAALSHCNQRIYTFTQGLIETRGSVQDISRWEHIETVWVKVVKSYSKTSYTYTVRRTDGKTFKFTSYLQNVVQLGGIIQQELVRAQMPRVTQAYNAGNTISFGPVNVNMQGLNNGKELIPWDQINSIVVRNGVLNVEKDGRFLRWSSIKAQNVPNIALLQELVSYIARGARAY